MMNFNVAIGCMRHLANGGAIADLSALVVTLDDYTVLTSDIGWTFKDKNTVVRVMGAFLGGVMDMVGAPRFELPAEYVAAGIDVCKAGESDGCM